MNAKKTNRTLESQPGGARERTFAALFGALLGLALLKFGNPVILEKLVARPESLYGWMVSAWPLAVGYWLLAAVAVAGVAAADWSFNAPKWLLALPLAWLGWQFVAATGTVDAPLTRAALTQFTACAACFYLGYFSLGGLREHRPFWLGLLGAFTIVLVVGFQQHFGGLADTRRYFWTYVYPHLKTVQPEYLKKMSSHRIFSTLFYPNTLAGALLLLLPPALAVFGKNRHWSIATRWLVVGVVVASALACLYWSGSKGGWLLMLFLGLVALLRLPFSRRLKILATAVILILGLAAFAVKYSAYFEKGATSVGARFDCWRAALQTTARHPLRGSGPGTFGVIYEKIKLPGAEMARLAHNDYLEQASDSGLPGFFAYLIFFVGGLIWNGRRAVRSSDPELFCLWLGLLGWSLEELIEFGLYIPAVAWPAFGLLGWLTRQSGNELSGNEFDKQSASR